MTSLVGGEYTLSIVLAGIIYYLTRQIIIVDIWNECLFDGITHDKSTDKNKGMIKGFTMAVVLALTYIVLAMFLFGDNMTFSNKLVENSLLLSGGLLFFVALFANWSCFNDKSKNLFLCVCMILIVSYSYKILN